MHRNQEDLWEIVQRVRMRMDKPLIKTLQIKIAIIIILTQKIKELTHQMKTDQKTQSAVEVTILQIKVQMTRRLLTKMNVRISPNHLNNPTCPDLVLDSLKHSYL